MAKVLGKGLDALIGTYNTDKNNQSVNYNLDITKIVPNPNQPRQKFNSQALNNLIQSIKEKGILQPLAVRKINNNSYELIAGERRLRAAKAIGLTTVPVFILLIKNDSEMMELALIENIQRDDLNAMEEAEGYAILSGKYNLTQEKIAKKVSKSRSEISNKLRLLKLPSVIQEGLRNCAINYGHARALIGIRKSTIMLKTFKKIIAQKLNVRQTETLINSFKKTPLKIPRKQNKYTKIEKKLANYLNTKLSIKQSKKHRGKIIIEFKTKSELSKITSLITKD